MTKIKTKDILIKILESTIEFSDNLQNLRRYQSAYLKGGFDYVSFLRNKEDRKIIDRKVYDLKRNNFIEEKKRGEKLFLVLTEKGQKEAIKYKIKNSKESPKNKYCVVVFDIPETERKIRDFFRRFLKDAEFKKLQQSVWFSKKDVSKEVVELIKSAGAKKWIHVITADFISDLK